MNLDVFLYLLARDEGIYPFFEPNQNQEFALLVSAERILTESDIANGVSKPAIFKTSQSRKTLEARPAGSYRIVAEVLFVSSVAIVIDCGILAYSDALYDFEKDLKVGDFVAGDVWFEVDPFPYYESLYKMDGIPPLIFRWRILSVEKVIGARPNVDGTTDTRARTFADIDSSANGDCVLHCLLREHEPKRTFSDCER